MTDLILSIDDYNPGNIELAKLIKSYGLESNTIFFIDLGLSVWEETPSEPNEAMKQIKELDSLGMEIGSHNLTHDNSLKEAPYEVQKRQIFKSKEIIEGITGKPCNRYCYNRGRSSEQIRQLVKEAGFLDARGTVVKTTLKMPKDKYNMYTTLHMFERNEYVESKEYQDCNPGGMFGRESYGSNWLDIAETIFNTIELTGSDAEYIHIWGHYKELSRPGEMDKFKEILEYMKSNK